MKKIYKNKARGFSKVNTKNRISRPQLKQLSDTYDVILKELQSLHIEKLNKTMSKFQTKIKKRSTNLHSKSEKQF